MPFIVICWNSLGYHGAHCYYQDLCLLVLARCSKSYAKHIFKYLDTKPFCFMLYENQNYFFFLQKMFGVDILNK